MPKLEAFPKFIKYQTLFIFPFFCQKLIFKKIISFHRRKEIFSNLYISPPVYLYAWLIECSFPNWEEEIPPVQFISGEKNCPIFPENSGIVFFLDFMPQDRIFPGQNFTRSFFFLRQSFLSSVC